MATDINVRHGLHLPTACALPTIGGNPPRPLIGACDAGGHDAVTQYTHEASGDFSPACEQSQSQRESCVNASAEHSAERVRYYLSFAAQPDTAAVDCRSAHKPRQPVPLPPGYLPGVV